MTPSPKVIPCGVAIIRRDQKFLIAQRKKNDSFGSYWEFPGGKKNHDESFEDCVVRESKEEIGVDVQVSHKLMEIRRPYNERIIWLNFYICSLVSGEPKAIECQKTAWVDLEEIKSYKFPPANDKVIQRLAEEFDSPLN